MGVVFPADVDPSQKRNKGFHIGEFMSIVGTSPKYDKKSSGGTHF